MMQNASYARWENSPGRQLAYRTYAADPSLPATAIARQLEAVHGLKVAVRTVQDWRERDQWEKRRALERLADSEVSIPEMIAGLRVAAPLAVAYVRAVMDGREAPNTIRLRAADLLIRLADEWRFDLAAQGYSRIDIEITPSRRPSRPGDDHWQVSVTAAKDLD